MYDSSMLLMMVLMLIEGVARVRGMAGESLDTEIFIHEYLHNRIFANLG